MKPFLVVLTTIVLLYLSVTFATSSMVLDTPNRTLKESYRLAEGRWKVNLDSLQATLPPPESITVTSPVDGIQLRGWLYRGTADCGMVFAHGYGDNRVSMLKYTPYFDRCGCSMLLYDHRGFGESDEAHATGGVNEATDLLAAHRALTEATGLPDDRIGWFGESWGAATALQAAAQENVAPAFVIAESPYADWETAVTERGVRQFGSVLYFLAPGTFLWVGLRNGTDFAAASPLRAAARVTAPVLLLHSRQDTLTAPEQSALIAEQVRPELLDYQPLDWGAWHAHNVIWRPREYGSIIERFLRERAPGFCS